MNPVSNALPCLHNVPPRISALVSTCNSERFMRGCLEDLLAQTIASQLEIIVVDSGSEQQEHRIVGEFQGRQPRIVLLRTPQRESLYAAWNRAIDLARGAYLTNANTDDRHAPHALERLAATLDAHPDAGVAYASAVITDEENATLDTACIKGRFKARAFDRRRLFRDCMPGPQPMWRRALHDRFGRFDETFRSAGDYEFWLRVSGGTRFVHVPEVLGLFLDSPASISHNRELTEREAEHARKLHWPAEWGPRTATRPPLLDTLTRRSTYRRWLASLTRSPRVLE